MKITNATKLPIFQKATKVLFADNKPQHRESIEAYFKLVDREVVDMAHKSNEVEMWGIFGVWQALQKEFFTRGYSV